MKEETAVHEFCERQVINCFLSGGLIDSLLSSGWDALDIVTSEPVFLWMSRWMFSYEGEERERAGESFYEKVCYVIVLVDASPPLTLSTAILHFQAILLLLYIYILTGDGSQRQNIRVPLHT